jgi:ribulose-phosphate 3-epimerase
VSQLREIKIAPSILAGDLADLEKSARVATDGGADQLHLDVIDGHFAPNITFGPGTVKSLRKKCDLKFDTHLMIDNPLFFAEKFIDAGSDLLTFHSEVLTGPSFDELHTLVRAKGRELGLAIKPSTELPSWASDRLDKIDTLLVMTVNPGFSGQSMDYSVMPKLARLSAEAKDKGLALDVEVDGGVEPENVQDLVRRGANVLVAGAGVYGKQDQAAAIGILRRAAMEAFQRA